MAVVSDEQKIDDLRLRNPAEWDQPAVLSGNRQSIRPAGSIGNSFRQSCQAIVNRQSAIGDSCRLSYQAIVNSSP
jgi:hypothetical protein